MTSNQKFDILNAYHGEVEHRKWFLVQTDYATIREAEGGDPMPEEMKQKRADARAAINQYEEWIEEIEAIEPEDPDMPDFEPVPAE